MGCGRSTRRSARWLSLATDPTVVDFSDRYAAALLDRDEDTIATLYAVPGLILFPADPWSSTTPS